MSLQNPCRNHASLVPCLTRSTRRRKPVERTINLDTWCSLMSCEINSILDANHQLTPWHVVTSLVHNKSCTGDTLVCPWLKHQSTRFISTLYWNVSVYHANNLEYIRQGTRLVWFLHGFYSDTKGVTRNRFGVESSHFF